MRTIARSIVPLATTARRRLACAAIGSLAFIALSVPLAGVATATDVARGTVDGVVSAASSGHAVAGASISIAGSGASARSSSDGRFAIAGVASRAPYRRLTVLVRARGFGAWTIRGVPLSPGDTLHLTVRLRRTGFDHRVLTPSERGTSRVSAPARAATGTAYTNTCTGWAYSLTPPPTIKVLDTSSGKASTYDFLFYVQHVLPNEWISSWDADALGAGAVAAKTYGMYRAEAGRAYSGGAGCADVQDSTSDQVFDPTWSTASTNLAVDATFGTMLLKSGATPIAQYYSGSPGDPCAAVTGTFAGRMSQWGTQTCAQNGKLWPDIVLTFYPSDTLSYVGNLLLDAGLQNDATWAWQTLPGTDTTRVIGSAYAGNAYLKSIPPSGSNGTVYQTRPFAGSATTRYSETAALKCITTSSSACTVVMRLILTTSSGSTWVNRHSVSVPSDSSWHLFTYSPPASGIVSASAQLSFICSRTIGVDGAVLTAPFGGP